MIQAPPTMRPAPATASHPARLPVITTTTTVTKPTAVSITFRPRVAHPRPAHATVASRTMTVRTEFGVPNVRLAKSGRKGGAVRPPTSCHHSSQRSTTVPM